MKKSNYFSIILLSFSVSSCMNTPEDAIKYFENIFKYQETVIEKEGELQNVILKFVSEPAEDSIADKTDTIISFDELDSAYNSFLNQINISLKEVKKIEAFADKTILRDAAINLLNAYKSVAENEYAEILKILEIPDEEITEDDNARFNELFSKQINLKLDKELDEFFEVQQAFADEYDFELLEEE